jgi:nucleoside phosphorylase
MGSSAILTHKDYTVAWICAIDTESAAACELLEEEHPSLPSLPHDNNAYNFGRVGNHNVVIAGLPKGKYGTSSAATVAKDLLRSFPSIRIGLMVGIGGGAPSHKHDIRLGDVVVSSPLGKTGGVVKYDFGKMIQGKQFEHTGSLNALSTALLTALHNISILHRRKGHRIRETVAAMVQRNRRMRTQHEHPGTKHDRLYAANHIHVQSDQPCGRVCGDGPLIQRKPRDADQDDPVIHYGLIASADKLMKDAVIRDMMAKEHDVLCFEMEAAGLMDNFNCIVIRGICDYADTHKNDQWQGYAAATAAAYAKELLLAMPGEQVVDMKPVAGSGLQSGELIY